RRPRIDELTDTLHPVRAEHEILRHRTFGETGIHARLHAQIPELTHEFTRDRRDTARRPRRHTNVIRDLPQQTIRRHTNSAVIDLPHLHLKPAKRNSPRMLAVKRLQT